MKDTIINIRASKKLKAQVKKAAEAEGLTTSTYITRLLTLKIKGNKIYVSNLWRKTPNNKEKAKKLV